MKALFISENTQDWDVIANIFTTHFPHIDLVMANGPEEAMSEACNNGPFGFYFLDIDSKTVDYNALGLNLVEFTGNRPVLFLGTETIFKTLITEDLYNYNEHNKEIFRPIDREEFVPELKLALADAMSWVKKEEFAQNLIEIDPSLYIHMKIKAFYLYNEFPYDIFMSITSNCYIKIITANKPYALSTISNYAKKNERFLYIKKDDHIKFLEQESYKCLKALDKIATDHKDLYLVLLRSISIMHQYMNTLGVTPKVQELADAIVGCVIEHVDSGISLGEILKVYPTLYQGTESKSLLTAFLANALSNEMKWDSNLTKRKLTLSSLIQDFNLEEEVLSKVSVIHSSIFESQSEGAQEKFLEHPKYCAEVAKLFTSYSDIDNIIENHHELPNRNGFPNQPSMSKLTPINAVFNISQHIAAELDGMELENSLFTKTLKGMSKDYGVAGFKEPLKLMQKVLKIK